MSASIDRYTFLSWAGRIPQAVRASREVTRPAIDGTGIIWDAWRRPKATIVTATVCDDEAEASATLIAFRNLIGQTVQVVDPIGTIYADVLVLDASVIQDQTLVDDQWLLTTTWSLLAASAAPTSTTP